MDHFSFFLLLCFAFLAGFIDSVVGGGGLVQLPAMMIFYPAMPVPSLMGTNKLAGFSGTAMATFKYIKQVQVPWKKILPGVFSALLFSFLGARVVSHVNKEFIKPLVLCLLILVAVYTFFKKDFGLQEGVQPEDKKAGILSFTIGAVMGFYDGFFGPGTGSFLIVLFISLFGFNFLMASASAKLLNCATNISALAYFAWTGQIIWEIGIPVALANMGGSWIGARMAIKKGSAFVRILFMAVVGFMILKLAWDLLS